MQMCFQNNPEYYEQFLKGDEDEDEDEDPGEDEDQGIKLGISDLAAHCDSGLQTISP